MWKAFLVVEGVRVRVKVGGVEGKGEGVKVRGEGWLGQERSGGSEEGRTEADRRSAEIFNLDWATTFSLHDPVYDNNTS